MRIFIKIKFRESAVPNKEGHGYMKGGVSKVTFWYVLFLFLSHIVAWALSPYTCQRIFIFVGQTRPKASCAPLTALFSA